MMPSQEKTEGKLKAFRITNFGKGFQITFPNGFMLSTQFSIYHYCENREQYKKGESLAEYVERTDKLKKTESWESNTAEIAIFDNQGEWVTREAHKKITGENLYDDVDGWIEIDMWLKYFDWTRTRRRRGYKKHMVKTDE